ncbi:hypothetical protein KAW1A4500_00014 [Escherichia phage vB_EcoP_KAW1A4500]|uniref:Uncharacterized protein n=1 Tax=Escherichia phage vB_EcoP_KAW1A4500 TaxID=2508205 RepID=A0A482MUD5_9CAUD|nr:hypothetical protein KAW1A4500_00014 [Escherichia phage vB_EcoP_KAW1A4500]
MSVLLGKVGALDECVKRIGTIKDRHAVTIFLVSHLTRPPANRTQHEEGGEVILSDFRGSGAIGFWASYALGLSVRERLMKGLPRTSRVSKTAIKVSTLEKVMLKGDIQTGRLMEPQARTKSFDTVKQGSKRCLIYRTL